MSKKIKNSRSVHFNLSLTEDEAEALKHLSQFQGVSISKLIGDYALKTDERLMQDLEVINLAMLSKSVEKM